MSELKNQISQFIDTNAKIYQDISLAIHAKPEVSDFEYFASQTLSEQLKKEGFEIELPAAGHRTGFAATYKSNKPGPTVVFLAEYDALAGLGHGCGHNVFGATSSLAGAALKSIVDQIGGEVRVYGTPGEEGGQNGSAKGSFVKKGYLNDVDFALCTHPGSGSEDGLSTRNYACAPVDIEFWGKPAHAAGCPQDGINALDAQILTYAAIGVLRQQLTDRIRIHGVIVEGGTAPNVIPEYTKAKYYIRAADIDTLHELYEKVENISVTGLSQNQDKRALYDRWQKPGDKAKFKGISQTDITPISSRFVQDNNYIAIESVRLAYEFPQRWMERIRFSGLTVSAYMNDICRFSTIKDERGISYPFARSVSMSISVNF